MQTQQTHPWIHACQVLKRTVSKVVIQYKYKVSLFSLIKVFLIVHRLSSLTHTLDCLFFCFIISHSETSSFLLLHLMMIYDGNQNLLDIYFCINWTCFDFFFCFISWSYIMEIKLNRYLLLHQLGEYVLIVCYFCFCFVKHQLAVLVWSIKLLCFLLLHLMMIYFCFCQAPACSVGLIN